MKKIFTISLLLAVFCASGVLNAQTVTWTGGGDGFNWSDADNWNPIGVPMASDDVIIPYNAFVDVIGTHSCKSLILNTSNTSLGSFVTEVYIYDGGKLTINGDLTIRGALGAGARKIVSTLYIGLSETIGTLVVQGNLILNSPTGSQNLAVLDLNKGNGILEIGGDFILVNNSGTLTSNALSSVICNGSSNQSIAISGGSNAINYSNLVIDKASGIASFNNSSNQINSAAISTSLHIKNGTLSNNGYLFNGAFASSLVVDAGAKLLLTGITEYPNFTGTNTLDDAATVEFGGASQLVSLPVGQKPNFVLSGSGIKTLAGSILVNDLVIKSGATFNTGGNSISIYKDFSNNGLFNEGIVATAFVGSGPQEVSGIPTFKKLIVNKPSGDLILTEPLTVTEVLTLANGTLVSDGKLTVNLSAGYVSTNTGGAVTGNVTFKKTVAHSKSSFLSAPVSTLASDFGAPLSIYDEGRNSGRYVLQNGALPVGPNGIGYSVNYGANTPTVELTGEFNNNLESATVTIKSTKSNGSTRAGWNIIGNPYAHDLDWDAVIAHADAIDPSSQIYSGIYYYIGNDNYSTYVSGVPGNGRFIPSMQGVMVYLHNSSAGDASYDLVLPRSAGNNSASILKRTTPITDVLKLSVSNGEDKDATYIRLSDEATIGFDKSLDAYKMKNGGATTPNLYTYNSVDIFSINSVPASFSQYSLPLAFEAKVNGEYTIELSEEYEYTLGYTIVLEDKKLGTFSTLNDDREYTFLASTSDNAARFAIHFSSPVVTSMDHSLLSKSVKVFVSNQDLVLSSNKLEQKATVAIFDLSGRLVANYENVDLASGRVTLSAPKQKGMYIVNITSPDFVTSEKVVINE
jgi:hypothetical protein